MRSHLQRVSLRSRPRQSHSRWRGRKPSELFPGRSANETKLVDLLLRRCQQTWPAERRISKQKEPLEHAQRDMPMLCGGAAGICVSTLHQHRTTLRASLQLIYDLVRPTTVLNALRGHVRSVNPIAVGEDGSRLNSSQVAAQMKQNWSIYYYVDANRRGQQSGGYQNKKNHWSTRSAICRCFAAGRLASVSLPYTNIGQPSEQVCN